MTDDQGWTTQTRYKTRRKIRGTANAIAAASTDPTGGDGVDDDDDDIGAGTGTPQFVPRTTGPLRTAAVLAADHEAVRAEWTASPAHDTLIRLVDQHYASASTTHNNTPVITKAVCLGTGTFDPSPDAGSAWASKRAAHVQLCALSTLISRIETHLLAAQSHNNNDNTPPPTNTIQRIIQEPILTTADQAFLSQLGYRVVASPAAYPLIDEHTLLFAVHLYRPIYAAALQSSLPAIFIGTGWHVWDTATMHQSTDDLNNMKIIDQTYSCHAFPQDHASTAFSSTSIYFRPAKR